MALEGQDGALFAPSSLSGMRRWEAETVGDELHAESQGRLEGRSAAPSRNGGCRRSPVGREGRGNVSAHLRNAHLVLTCVSTEADRLGQLPIACELQVDSLFVSGRGGRGCGIAQALGAPNPIPPYPYTPDLVQRFLDMENDEIAEAMRR